MNERFFELKKDRQDRIINGAMRIFTEYGYRHASTDEMVAAASISKGLLFHYFKSKKGTFEFLYEYSTRYMLLEMREASRRKGCDYFEMQRLLCQADTAVLRKYPYMPLFLERADREHIPAGIQFPEDLDGAVAALRADLLGQSAPSPFFSGEELKGITGVLGYTRTGLMQELLLAYDPVNNNEKETAESLPSDSTDSSTGSTTDSSADSSTDPSTGSSKGSLPADYAARFNSCLQLLRKM